MNFEHIKEAVKEANKIKSIINDIESLVIDWETDINKMDFSKLKSYNFEKQSDIKITYQPPPKLENYYNYFDGNMFDLVDFIKNSNKKIIPPFKKETTQIKDGKKKILENDGYFDGNHRTVLASILNLKKIPVVLFPATQYIFDVKNTFLELNETELIIKNNNKKIILTIDFAVTKINYINIDNYHTYNESTIIIDTSKK